MLSRDVGAAALASNPRQASPTRGWLLAIDGKGRGGYRSRVSAMDIDTIQVKRSFHNAVIAKELLDKQPTGTVLHRARKANRSQRSC